MSMSEVEFQKALRAVSGLQMVGWSVHSWFFSSFHRGASCVPTKTEHWNGQIMEVRYLTWNADCFCTCWGQTIASIRPTLIVHLHSQLNSFALFGLDIKEIILFFSGSLDLHVVIFKEKPHCAKQKDAFMTKRKELKSHVQCLECQFLYTLFIYIDLFCINSWKYEVIIM